MIVYMFGSLRLHVGERELQTNDLGGIKPKQVLELLLLARGHAVTTDALADALWADRQPVNAAATLHTYVSVLRNRMFDDPAHARRVLVTSPKAYRFALDQGSIDRDDFDDLIVRARMATHEERRRLLTKAVTLASADLLEDAPYDAWVQSERDRYRDRTAQANLSLAREWLLMQDQLMALYYADAALRFSPYSEEAFRIVMLANYALGHDEIARRAGWQCRALIEDELGADITTLTRHLAGAIDAGVPSDELVTDFLGASHGMPPTAEPLSA
jgi:DNA-binding SARP family transcriptional activator